MTALAIDYRRHVKRPIGFVVVGILLLGAAGYLWYDSNSRRTTVEPSTSTYNYSVKQSVDKQVVYFPSSFYDNGPGKNTAYIMTLTDKILATFNYAFSGSEQQQLSYAYDVKAVVRATYSTSGDEKDTANVWTKEYQLLDPVHATVVSKGLTFNPSVEIPYDQYRHEIEQLRTSLTLPVRSDVTITYTVSVAGEVGGTPFNDLRTASVTVPIEEQIYAISQKYDKEDTKQVVAKAAQASIDRIAQYEYYGAIALGVLALAAFVYGFRKRIFKTPYQRELDKIYRYHDGIIVRASRRADLSGKRIVPVKSFDDILNLEEELKLPIIAASVSATATQFMIIRDDVVYVYTLGKLPPSRHGRSLEEIADAVKAETPPEFQPLQPTQSQSAPKPPRKIQ